MATNRSPSSATRGVRTVVECRRERKCVHLAHRGLGKALVVVAEADASQSRKAVDNLTTFAVVNEHPLTAGDHGRAILGMLAQIGLRMHVMCNVLCNSSGHIDVHVGTPREALLNFLQI